VNISRRRLLQYFSCAAALPAVHVCGLSRADSTDEFWWSAGSDYADGTGLAGFSGQGRTSVLATAFRGHGLCAHPLDQRVVMMARRPGYQGVVYSSDGTPLQFFSSRSDRQFQGHACFSQDGRRLFTAEIVVSDDDSLHGRGRIGIRDAETFTWLGEYDSGGVEPHELKLMPDGESLVIANGGLTPSREDGRENDQRFTMDSSLVLLNSHTGKLTARHTLTEPMASIRHLDVAADGTVVVALQVQRQWLNDTHVRPLVAVLPADNPESLSLLEAPDNLWLALRDYMGSVVVHPDYRVAAVTSPRGNLVAFWELQQKTFLGYFPLHDVCGISLSAKHDCFVATNSAGDMRFIDPVSLKEIKSLRRHTDAVRWDNHLLGPLTGPA